MKQRYDSSIRHKLNVAEQLLKNKQEQMEMQINDNRARRQSQYESVALT